MNDVFDGDNKGPKDVDYYRQKAKSLRERALSWRGQEITDKNQSIIAEEIKQVSDVRKRADADRKELIAPWQEKVKETNADYRDVIDIFLAIEADMKKGLQAYLIELEKRKIQERKRAEEEFERLNKEAQELKDDALLGIEAARAAGDALQEKERLKRDTAKAKPEGGGRALGLRTKRKVSVNDYGALVLHYADHYQMKELAEKLANMEIRAAKGRDVRIPGCTVIETKTV